MLRVDSALFTGRQKLVWLPPEMAYTRSGDMKKKDALFSIEAIFFTDPVCCDRMMPKLSSRASI